MEAKRQSLPFGRATAESDKDSGVSEGSLDYLNSAESTNSEDSLRALWQHPAAAFSPVVVMKNMVVKQGRNSSQFPSRTVQPSRETMSTQQARVVLHPPVPSAVTLQVARGKKSDSSDLLPILNSYAKMALHPYKRGLEDREETSRQKRLRTSGKDASPNLVSSLSSGLCHRGPLALRPSGNFLRQDVPGRNAAALHRFKPISVTKSDTLGCAPAFSTPASPASENPARGVAQTASCNPLVLGKQLGGSSDLPLQQPSKNKRFQNTLVVLHKSGLLEITLKTKKLISQNLVTQVELGQLKQQTQLFMEALKNNAPQAWAELEVSLRQSNKDMSSLLNSPGI